jgi:ribosomal protein S18 acetylase RimI-like enzyme
VVVDVLGLRYRTIHLPNDAAMVARNRRDACIETFGDDANFEGDVRYLAWLRNKVEEFPDGFVLAYDREQCVGHLELEVPYGLPAGYVNLFYIMPDLRGSGYGRLLHAYAEQYFRSWDANRVELHVSPTNRRAMEFYRKLGYRSVALEGAHAPLWRMELRIAASAPHNSK